MDINNSAVLADAITRDADECIVSLTAVQAAQVSAEVDANDHQTFDDALAYIIERGLAEIKRQRDSAVKQKAKQAEVKNLMAAKTLLASNPALALDPAKLFAMLGIAMPTPKA